MTPSASLFSVMNWEDYQGDDTNCDSKDDSKDDSLLKKKKEVQEEESTQKMKKSKKEQLEIIRDKKIPEYQKQYPHLLVGLEFADWTDYMKAHGLRYTHYNSAFSRWLRKAEKFRLEREQKTRTGRFMPKLTPPEEDK